MFARPHSRLPRAAVVLASVCGAVLAALALSLAGARAAFADPVAPDAPFGVSVTPTNGALHVSWEPPLSDNGSAISGYDVSAFSSALASGTTVHVGSDQSSADLDGLHNGSEYDVTVVALNDAGTSAPATANGTPRTLPGVPASVAVSPVASGVVVSWTPPLDNGGDSIASYVVTAASGVGVVVDGAVRTAQLSGLANGVSTTVTVAASNAAGTGPALTSSTVVPRIPAQLVVVSKAAARAVYGTASTVAAAVRTTGGAGVPAVKVALLARASSSTTTWRQVAAGTSDSTGRLTLRATFSVNTELRLHILSAEVVGADLAAGNVSVAPRVSTPAMTAVRLGGTTTATGSVAPAVAKGSAVRLQRVSGGKWVTVASGTMTTSTTYRVTWKPRASGRFTVRILKPADGSRVQGWSASRTLTVYPERALDVARQIRANTHVHLDTVHSSGVHDHATAWWNLWQVASGQRALRSSYGNAPGGSTLVDLQLLRALRSLGTHATVRVSEVAGGSHAARSAHYSGRGLDISAVNGAPVRRGSSYWVVVKVCRYYGAQQVFYPAYDPYGGHQNHVHCGW